MVEGNLGGSSKGNSGSGKETDFAGLDLLGSIDGNVASDGEGMKDLEFAQQEQSPLFLDAYQKEIPQANETPVAEKSEPSKVVENTVKEPTNLDLNAGKIDVELAVPPIEITGAEDNVALNDKSESGADNLKALSVDDSVSRVAAYSPSAAANLDKLSQRLS